MERGSTVALLAAFLALCCAADAVAAATEGQSVSAQLQTAAAVHRSGRDLRAAKPPAFRLHGLYRSNMVLQRNADGTVIGFAPAGTRVTVTLVKAPPAGRRRLQAAAVTTASASGSADATGEWNIKLGKLAVGGPYTLTASSSAGKSVITNVMVGEVFWMAGQSNAIQTLTDIPLMAISTGRAFIPQAMATIAAITKAPSPDVRFCEIPALRPSPEQADLVVGSAYEGLRGPRQNGTYTASWRPLDGAATKLFGAAGLLTARQLNAVLKVPVGIIQVAWSGSTILGWIDQAMLKTIPGAPTSGGGGPENSFAPSMVRPLRGIPFNSVIWWQGETDAGLTYVGNTWNIYDKLLAGLFKSWRSYLQLPNLKFHVVQLQYYASTYKTGAAPIQRGLGHWAVVREAQRRVTQSDPLTDLICTIDIGTYNNPHPENKFAIAARIAKSILADFKVANQAKTGPTLKNVSLKTDGTATVSFNDYGAGLIVGMNDHVHPFKPQAITTPVGCFELLGVDGVWRRATGTVIALSSGAPRTAVKLKLAPAGSARVAGPVLTPTAASQGQTAVDEEAASGDAPAPGFAVQPAGQQRRRRLLGIAPRGVRYAYADAPDGCNLYASTQLPTVPFLYGGSYP